MGKNKTTKKGKAPMGIAFSDVHINLWTKFNAGNSRTMDGFKVLHIIKKQCIKLNVPAFFMGDLLHKPENIDNELFGILVDEFLKLNSEPFWNCYFIEGNHEIKNRNTLISLGNEETSEPTIYSSPGFVYSFSKIFNWLKPIVGSKTLYGGYRVWGLHYLDHNLGLNHTVQEIAKKFRKHEKNILMLHTDYPGAKDTDNSEVGSCENLNLNLLNKFDLVLMGHIHKPQRLSKKVYMVGAPFQQRRTDKDCDLGYWIIYDDLSMEFKSLSKKFPKFIDVENEEDKKEDGNYYTVIPKRNLEKQEVTTNRISANLSKVKLAKRYLSEKGIKDKGKAKLLKQLLKDDSND